MAKKRRIRWKRVILAFLALIILLTSLAMFITFKYFETTAKEQNILLLGTDGRTTLGDDIRRSDTIMIINVKPKTGDVTMTSIPRDSLIELSCKGFEDKINHGFAYAFVDAYEQAVAQNNQLSEAELIQIGDVAGANCVKSSVEAYFDIHIDETIMVDFADLIHLINILGGITITSTATFCEMDSNDVQDAICFNEGETYLMNGEQALSYARHRKTDNDIARNQRQQEVMSSLFNQLQSVKYTQLPKLYDFFKKEIYNTYKFRDIIDLVFVKLNHIKLNRVALEGEDYFDGYAYYYLILEDSRLNTKKLFDKQD